MKQTVASIVIVIYLSALGWGVVSHTLTLGNAAHPVMYYLVWDMFCGWSGYESRHHLVAEGVSGAHYELTPAPWGEFQPYGPAYRPDYDSFTVHSIAIAHNVLARTEHEPIRKIYLIEENWSKRYNLPDYLWVRQFEEPKTPRSYFHKRVTFDDLGNVIDMKNNWTTAVYEYEVFNEPRMARIRQQARPFIAVQHNRKGQFSAEEFGHQPLPLPGSVSPIQQSSHSTISFD